MVLLFDGFGFGVGTCLVIVDSGWCVLVTVIGLLVCVDLWVCYMSCGF